MPPIAKKIDVIKDGIYEVDIRLLDSGFKSFEIQVENRKASCMLPDKECTCKYYSTADEICNRSDRKHISQVKSVNGRISVNINFSKKPQEKPCQNCHTLSNVVVAIVHLKLGSNKMHNCSIIHISIIQLNYLVVSLCIEL